MNRFSDHFFFPSISCLQSFFFRLGDWYDAFAQCKGIQGTVGFLIPRLGFRIPCTVHVFCWWNLFSGFQSLLGFWITQEKCRIGFWILQAKIRKAGIRIPLHRAIHFTATAFNLIASEQQRHFRSSLLSLRKIASANPSGETISLT